MAYYVDSNGNPKKVLSFYHVDANGNISKGSKAPNLYKFFYFVSNGDGTCYVFGNDPCQYRNLIIPHHSEDGDTVTEIRSYAFYFITKISTVNIPNSVTSIGNYAFEYCTNLTSVTIGNSVTSIGNYAFKNCASLSRVNIPNSVTSIGIQAFNNCSNLIICSIGNGVTMIRSNAFYNCRKLTKIQISATTPPTLETASVFSNTNNCPIYVPAASVNAYKTATNWAPHASRIQAIQ